jgi:peptide/nickel transport system permease protein
MGFALVGVSTPVFFLGTGVLYGFWFKLHLLPGTGYVPLSHGVGPWFAHLIGPWIVLALLFAAFYARMARATLIETLREDFVRTAQAKGLSHPRVIRHALRASVTPLVTMFGMDLGQLFGGAVITETVFNLPGLGNAIYFGIQTENGPLVVGLVVLSAIIFIFTNLFVDLLCARIDPRITYE